MFSGLRGADYPNMCAHCGQEETYELEGKLCEDCLEIDELNKSRDVEYIDISIFPDYHIEEAVMSEICRIIPKKKQPKLLSLTARVVYKVIR